MFDLRFDSRIQISIKGRTSLKQQLDVRLLVDQIHAHAYMRITRTKGLIISWGLLDLPKFDLPEFSIKLDGASIGAWPIYFLKNWIIPFQLRRKLVIPFIKTIIRGGSRLPTTAEHKNPQLPEAPLDGTAVVDAALLNEGASNSPNANSLLVEQPSSLAVSPADSGGYSSRKSKLLSRVTLKIKERVPASLLANADHFKLAAGGLVQKARQTYKNNTRSSVTEATVATKTEPIASVPIVAGAVSGEDANEDEEAEEDDDLAEAVQIIDSLSAGNFQQLDDPVVEFGFLAEADHQFPPLLPLRSAVPTNIADDSKVIFNGELPPKEIRGIVVKIIDEALEGISVPPPLPNR
jgi:hypothetical protein